MKGSTRKSSMARPPQARCDIEPMEKLGGANEINDEAFTDKTLAIDAEEQRKSHKKGQ